MSKKKTSVDKASSESVCRASEKDPDVVEFAFELGGEAQEPPEAPNGAPSPPATTKKTKKRSVFFKFHE